MFWILLLIVLLAIICGILLSPIVLKIDSRIPVVILRWSGIGEAGILYEDEWRLKLRLPFFYREWSLMQLLLSASKKKPGAKPGKKKKGKKRMNFRMVISLLKSFRVVKFNVAVCNLDYTTNARWYFLNHLPGISKHVHINFEDENYFNLVVKNNAWSIVYAFIKQRTLNFKMNNYVNQS